MKLRRLFILGMLLWAPAVWAQLSNAELEDISSKMITNALHAHSMMVSGGCNGYSFGTTPYTWLSTSDEAALGNVAVMLNVSATDGTKASHQMIAGAGTSLRLNWHAYNFDVLTISYQIDNGSWVTWGTNLPSQGYGAFTLLAAWAGHNINLQAFATGIPGAFIPQTTSLASITVTSQAPGIYHYDNLPDGLYLQINPNFGGGSMDATCQICSQQPSACSGAQHTPYLSGSMTDNVNGQVQTFQKQVAGSVVNETSPISGSAFWDISAMPSGGGDISTNATGEIFCSAMQDDIYDQLWTMRIEYAKVVVKDLGHPGRPGADGSTIYDVAPICDNNSDPADWQPTVVHSFSGRHPYWWGVTSLVRAPDIQGMRWIALANFLVDWTPQSGVLNLAKMVIEGGAVPYPGGTAPDFPIPGACTQYPKNVILTLGIAARDFPFWPFNTQN